MDVDERLISQIGSDRWLDEDCLDCHYTSFAVFNLKDDGTAREEENEGKMGGEKIQERKEVKKGKRER